MKFLLIIIFIGWFIFKFGKCLLIKFFLNNKYEISDFLFKMEDFKKRIRNSRKIVRFFVEDGNVNKYDCVLV